MIGLNKKQRGDLIESIDDIPAGTKIKIREDIWSVKGYWKPSKKNQLIVIETVFHHPKIGLKRFTEYMELEILFREKATIAY